MLRLTEKFIKKFLRSVLLKKECIETQKPKLYEHIMQIVKYSFAISIKV